MPPKGAVDDDDDLGILGYINIWRIGQAIRIQYDPSVLPRASRSKAISTIHTRTQQKIYQYYITTITITIYTVIKITAEKEKA